MKKTIKNRGSFTTVKLQAISLRLIAIIALAVVIGFSMAACDNGDDDTGGNNNNNGGNNNNNNNNGGNNSSTEATLTMKGDYFSYSNVYSYTFRNYSSLTVTVTINATTKTLMPYAVQTGDFHPTAIELPYSTSNANATVTYKPANNLRYEVQQPSSAIAGYVAFYDK